jgi:hypothetical protein
MFWLTWRQFRTQAIAAAVIVVAVAVFLIISGLGLRHSYDHAGLPHCLVHHDCERLATAFVDQLKSGKFIFIASSILLYVVPGLIGLFWGAPLLAREFETGTVRLAWNQSVTRNRWVLAKLGIVGLAAMAAAGLLSLLITWWASPLDQALNYVGPYATISLNRLDPTLFGARGIAPIGYAAFAVALGVAAGVLIRRTIPAMAVTIAVFAAVQLIWPNWVRPHLIPPTVVRASLGTTFDDLYVTQPGGQMFIKGPWYKSGAWILSNQTVTPSGHVFTGPATSACLGNSTQACLAWVTRQKLAQLVSYQPANRFWALQWYEMAVFLVLAAGLGWLCAWWVNRHRLA